MFKVTKKLEYQLVPSKLDLDAFCFTNTNLCSNQNAKCSTIEPINEQPSACVDMLTNGKRQTFIELNQNYTNKFGFPFIIVLGIKQLLPLQPVLSDRRRTELLDLPDNSMSHIVLYLTCNL